MPGGLFECIRVIPSCAFIGNWKIVRHKIVSHFNCQVKHSKLIKFGEIFRFIVAVFLQQVVQYDQRYYEI